MEQEIEERWSAKVLAFYDGKVAFEDVYIPNANSAFAITAFCKRLEKQKFRFNFEIENVEIETKEDSDELIRSLMKFSKFPKFRQLSIYPHTNYENEEVSDDTEVSDEPEVEPDPEVELDPEVKAELVTEPESKLEEKVVVRVLEEYKAEPEAEVKPKPKAKAKYDRDENNPFAANY